MDARYNPNIVDAKWQKIWAEQNADLTSEDADKPKFYALSMFPYPSGNLHMGHVRNYTITDAIARVKRMQGYRVLHPMGWDAFGLPAENAAIDRGIHPAEWTESNIKEMKTQLGALGLSYDWSREVATCRPDYYKWTQWIFQQFLEAGLAYQKEATVNWDPVDQTVLANEQVDSEGRSWRSGALVERRQLRQWFFKITDYAEQLLQDLDTLNGWPERVKTMQANWIGKSTGAYLEFPIVGNAALEGQTIAVFTTRPDTVYGVTYVVLAPEHPLTAQVTTESRKAAVEAFVEEIGKESEIDRTAEDRPKRGIPTGGVALNPFTGEEIPIWIADYVLFEYGTGAVMGVPTHDQRDFQFAKQNDLPLKVVIAADKDASTDPAEMTEAYTDAGVLVNSGEFNGLPSAEGKAKIIEYAETQGYGRAKVQYRLRDWLISRQRYWGVPIPVIHCPNCGAVPVPQDELPVELPSNVEFSGRGPSPLAQLEDWINVPCPNCDTPGRRETDTMDTFIDSSWYFLRYPDANNADAAFDPEKTNDWAPVDQYVGGIEHAILHLLYSRFFTKVLRDRGLVNFGEPFKRLLTQGMVESMAYKNIETGKYVAPADVDSSDPDAPKEAATGAALQPVFEKMSKSKYNGVDPGAVLDKYGADTARMFILFKAPPEKGLEWDDADVEGQFRFLNRVWRLAGNYLEAKGGDPQKVDEKSEKELRRAIHTAIKEISEDLDGDYQFNTAISELMKLSNTLNDYKVKTSPVYQEGVITLISLLAPFSPHIAEEIWEQLGNKNSVHQAPWPKLDESALVADEMTIVIQIKGKTRGTIQMPAGCDHAEQEKFATESDVAQKYIAGKDVKKVIVVPGRLVNFVVV
ncbi:MAG: leucine--tRNA ligase [Cyanophyceae cyanobacterium]